MEQLLHTRRAVNGDILPSARVAERRRNPAPSARALRLRVQRQARLRALLLVAPNIELTASQATYLQCRAGARESKPGSLNGPSRRENRLAWAAIRKPAEVNCPAALARAGYPWGCNTPRGRSAGAVTKRPVGGSSGLREARAKPTAAPPCDPPEQVTGAQWGQARGNQLKPARCAPRRAVPNACLNFYAARYEPPKAVLTISSVLKSLKKLFKAALKADLLDEMSLKCTSQPSQNTSTFTYAVGWLNASTFNAS